MSMNLELLFPEHLLTITIYAQQVDEEGCWKGALGIHLTP